MKWKQNRRLFVLSGRGPYLYQPVVLTGPVVLVVLKWMVDMLTPADSHEEETKKNNGVAEHMRLGCQTAVLGAGVKVRIVNVLGEDLVE